MGAKYLVVRAVDLKPGEVPLQVSLALHIMERAIHYPVDIRQLASLSQGVMGGVTRGSSTVHLPGILGALGRGEIVLLNRRSGVSAQESTQPESVTEQLKLAKQVKTWVEMEVVDMEGNPVPNQRYLCALPNGQVQEGVLDSRGMVRFDGIDPGNCVFVLTELDGEAWQRVS